VRGEHGLLGAVIGEARPVAVDGEELTLAFPSSAQFSKKKAEDPANRAAVGEALRAVMGGRWKLSYELRDEPASEDRRESHEHSEEEWVARFMREFDAEEIPGERSEIARQPAPGAEDEHGAQAVTSTEAVTSNEKGA
jgi:hypothetical protein